MIPVCAAYCIRISVYDSLLLEFDKYMNIEHMQVCTDLISYHSVCVCVWRGKVNKNNIKNSIPRAENKSSLARRDAKYDDEYKNQSVCVYAPL